MQVLTPEIGNDPRHVFDGGTSKCKANSCFCSPGMEQAGVHSSLFD